MPMFISAVMNLQFACYNITIIDKSAKGFAVYIHLVYEARISTEQYILLTNYLSNHLHSL